MPASVIQFQACGIQDTKKPNIGEENAKEVKLVKCLGENGMFSSGGGATASHSQPQPRLEKCDVETVFACWLVPSRAKYHPGSVVEVGQGHL